MVTARRFTVIIEETLLLKLLSFFGYGQIEAGESPASCNFYQEDWFRKPNTCCDLRAGEV